MLVGDSRHVCNIYVKKIIFEPICRDSSTNRRGDCRLGRETALFPTGTLAFLSEAEDLDQRTASCPYPAFTVYRSVPCCFVGSFVSLKLNERTTHLARYLALLRSNIAMIGGSYPLTKKTSLHKYSVALLTRGSTLSREKMIVFFANPQEGASQRSLVGDEFSLHPSVIGQPDAMTLAGRSPVPVVVLLLTKVGKLPDSSGETPPPFDPSMPPVPCIDEPGMEGSCCAETAPVAPCCAVVAYTMLLDVETAVAVLVESPALCIAGGPALASALAMALARFLSPASFSRRCFTASSSWGALCKGHLHRKLASIGDFNRPIQKPKRRALCNVLHVHPLNEPRTRRGVA